MKVKVERRIYDEKQTIGRLLIDGDPFCFTMEDAIREVKVWGETCIPVGIYDVGIRYSPKFSPRYGHEMMWIMNVPFFEFILIHPLNTHLGTQGCLGVGRSIGAVGGNAAILDSRSIYDKLYEVMITPIRLGNCTIEFVIL